MVKTPRSPPPILSAEDNDPRYPTHRERAEARKFPADDPFGDREWLERRRKHPWK